MCVWGGGGKGRLRLKEDSGERIAHHLLCAGRGQN